MADYIWLNLTSDGDFTNKLNYHNATIVGSGLTTVFTDLLTVASVAPSTAADNVSIGDSAIDSVTFPFNVYVNGGSSWAGAPSCTFSASAYLGCVNTTGFTVQGNTTFNGLVSIGANSTMPSGTTVNGDATFAATCIIGDNSGSGITFSGTTTTGSGCTITNCTIGGTFVPGANQTFVSPVTFDVSVSDSGGQISLDGGNTFITIASSGGGGGTAPQSLDIV